MAVRAFVRAFGFTDLVARVIDVNRLRVNYMALELKCSRLEPYSAMRLRSSISINDKHYPKGANLPWYKIYPFFLVHMLGFGLSGFFMAYAIDGPGLFFLYLHGGFAILVYMVFYLALFGLDQIRWMFINAALGLFGIYAQIDLILSYFGKRASDYSPAVHVIPFLYYILYTFLLYQMILDITGARADPQKKRKVEAFYIVLSVVFYSTIYLTRR